MLVLRMFELCCDHRNFCEAKLKLLDFQKTLLTVSKQPRARRHPPHPESCALTAAARLCCS